MRRSATVWLLGSALAASCAAPAAAQDREAGGSGRLSERLVLLPIDLGFHTDSPIGWRAPTPAREPITIWRSTPADLLHVRPTPSGRKAWRNDRSPTSSFRVTANQPSTRNQRFSRTAPAAIGGSFAGAFVGAMIAGTAARQGDYGDLILSLLGGTLAGSSLGSATGAYIACRSCEGVRFRRPLAGSVLGIAPGVATAAIASAATGGNNWMLAIGAYATGQGLATALVTAW